MKENRDFGGKKAGQNLGLSKPNRKTTPTD
jgi:hypothetical protein